MRKSQELQLSLSELRSDLATVTAAINTANAAGNDPAETDVAKADKLTRQIRSTEVQYRAATIAEEQEDREAERRGGYVDPATAEYVDLERRSRVGNYLIAARSGRPVAGAESELNQALHFNDPENGFPLRLLAPERRSPEHRATTDVDTVQNSPRWLDRLFADTAAMHLGVTMEAVPAGVSSYPVTTAGASAAQRAKEQGADDAAWTIGVSTLDPTRNAVRAVFAIEDAARVPGLEDSLSRDLRMALAEGVDRAIFLGDDGTTGNAANIAGFNTLAIGEVTLTQADKIKGPETLAAFAGLIDGIHAARTSDLRVVSSVGANALWLATLANDRDMTIDQFLRDNGVGHMVRGEIEAATAAGDFGAFIGRGRGIQGAAVAPVWEEGQLIRDPYTKAGSGEVALTLSYLWNFGLPRASNFARLKFVA